MNKKGEESSRWTSLSEVAATELLDSQVCLPAVKSCHNSE